MRYIVLLIALFFPVFGFSQEWEDQQTFGSSDQAPLRILSSTDTSFFAPIIEDFIASYSNIAVEYVVTGTADIDRIFRATPEQFDVVISSAMDLQLKLTNDGFAVPVLDVEHPDWAQWGDSLFAFTSEPAAIVINRHALSDLPTPSSRQDLIELMRKHPHRFQGRVGTYDVRQSGLGYLFATQDARASETYWRLMEVMGRMDAQLYCCSGQMIDDLREGDLLLAYNVLGSYARNQAEISDELMVILPSDFPITMMRTVLVSANATNPEHAESFVRHLLALQTAADPLTFPLPPLSGFDDNIAQRTINLNPALMTYLDQMKRDAFISEWENAIVQDK
ncbi:ABC transporter substrate-binding protein [Loktanella sp. D2R18]|uniref:ABC transporter substrate-binding protein n=1 Tax=Rhodobacterales TaxID=204455 RepID=UPI000DEACDC1|nr:MULTISPECIES: ABC transporter substrate-binding protein [Rhodobacterales]MDO6589493.1 ABC transporter substrate-binding protein [Yoonia sp. 1_MG-2023]RBW44141.1 ABC transporter substrate-binding protein [Loktanella sp. D2R18]